MLFIKQTIFNSAISPEHSVHVYIVIVNVF